MAVFLIALAYLAGSIPTGVLLARRAGIDVQLAGSGNIGATNVARTAGRSLGILTLVGDLVKGLVPVLVARALRESAAVVGAVAVAAILGHVFSAFLRLRGGKGVATGLGVLLGLAPLATALPLAVFVVAVAASRIVSLASIGAAVTAPVALWLFGQPAEIIMAGLVISSLIIWRHLENIARLLAGTEPKFGART